MANRHTSTWKYYAFVVWCAGMSVVFGIMAIASYELQRSLDKLPDHDRAVGPAAREAEAKVSLHSLDRSAPYASDGTPKGTWVGSPPRRGGYFRSGGLFFHSA